MKIQEKDKDASIGILTRRKQELFEVSALLRKFGIKHSLGSLNNIFENQFVQEILHILHIIDKTKDSELELFHLLNQLNLKELTIRKICNKKTSILEAIKDNPSEDEDENKLLNDLSKKLNSLIKLKESKTRIDEIILKITSTFKYYEKALLNSDQESISAMNAFIEYSKSFSNTYKTANLDKFIKICQYSKSLNLDFEEDGEAAKIELITIHQSKGKEYDYVFLPFLNDRKFPGQFRQTLFKTRVDLSREEVLDEEKRLLFVAISRAKKSLILSYVKKYSQNILESKPSKLLEDLKLETKTYNTKFPDYNPSTKENLKLDIIKKISEQLIDNQFNNAKKEIEVLSSMFGKKDLNSFLNPELNESVNNYKKKIENKEKLNINPKSMVYSVSQVQTYDSCPKKYMYQYIYKVPTQPKHYFDFGTTMHSVLENLTPKFLENLSKEELEEIALKDMHSNWISNAYESITQEEEYKKKGEQAIKNFIQRELQLKKEKRETIETENKFEIEIEGKRFIGYIDRTDKVGDNIEIMDYKTSNSMETEKKLVDNLQLGVYALAVKEKYKKFPHKVAQSMKIHLV